MQPHPFRSLGVGVIGTGDIAGIYLRNIPAFEGVHLVACAGRTPEAVRARADAAGIDALSIDAMLARQDVDIVVNLTPPAVHAELTLASVAAGKHVYSEKPLAVTLSEGRALALEAERLGVRLACAPDTFLGAAGRLARSMVDSGKIGHVLSGTCTFMSHGMEGWHPNPAFFFREGAGPVFDIGPYYLTALINLLGPIVSVQAQASKGFEERVATAAGPMYGQRIPVSTPTTVMALLQFRSGAHISMTMSWDVWRHGHNPIEIYGTEGSMRLADPDRFGGVVSFTRAGGAWQEVDSGAMPLGTANWRSPRARPDAPASANYRGVGVADLARGIGAGRPHRCSARLALHVTEAMEAILSAAALGRAVDLETSVERPESLSDEAATALLGPDSAWVPFCV
ncbi:Gfo/Idh/MocA family oxidoreductase [Agrobacterium tumefaciens]|nr:Gfo/Idh/MocA family oxidoreductase [Agrobacterium tumefaciens]UXT00435.1 Gfo/Idh/MocA family oxidoreductase [Agrobacterium tumefaciens]